MLQQDAHLPGEFPGGRRTGVVNSIRGGFRQWQAGPCTSFQEIRASPLTGSVQPPAGRDQDPHRDVS